MTRTFITQVETTIKCGGRAQLGEHTLLVGKPRTGKSTIVNALEAAGTGRVSDVAGRATLAREADLSMLGDSIFATAVHSDGRISSWSLEKGHRAKRSGPEIAFPLREVREALLGEPDKARRWILAKGKPFDWDDVEALVPEALRSKLRSIIWDATVHSDPSARLAGAIDGAKQRVRAATTRAKSHSSQPAGPPPTETELKAAEIEVSNLSAAGQLSGVLAQLIETRIRISRARESISAGEAALAKSLVDLAALPKIPRVSDVTRAAFTVVTALNEAKSAACLVCGGKADPAVIAARAAKAKALLSSAIEMENRARELQRQQIQFRDSLAIDRNELGRLEVEEKRLATIEAAAARVKGEGAEDRIVLARATLSELHARKAAWDQARLAATDVLQAEREALEWSQIADALSVALGTLVERARKTFEARVQGYLPREWIFGVDLLDGDREVLRIGLRVEAGSTVRAALSGVEWATVTAALALATAPDTGPVVIVPDDRAFDPETLAQVMESFASMAGGAQVIMTSPIMPARDPAGWTILTTPLPQPVIAAPSPTESTAPAPTNGPRKGGRPSNAQRRAELLTQSAAHPRVPDPPFVPPPEEKPTGPVDLGDLFE